MFSEEPLPSKTSPVNWLRQLLIYKVMSSPECLCTPGKITLLPTYLRDRSGYVWICVTTLDLIQRKCSTFRGWQIEFKRKNWMPEKCMAFWQDLLDKILVDAPCSGIGLCVANQISNKQRNIRFSVLAEIQLENIR